MAMTRYGFMHQDTMSVIFRDGHGNYFIAEL